MATESLESTACTGTMKRRHCRSDRPEIIKTTNQLFMPKLLETMVHLTVWLAVCVFVGGLGEGESVAQHRPACYLSACLQAAAKARLFSQQTLLFCHCSVLKVEQCRKSLLDLGGPGGAGEVWWWRCQRVGTGKNQGNLGNLCTDNRRLFRHLFQKMRLK